MNKLFDQVLRESKYVDHESGSPQEAFKKLKWVYGEDGHGQTWKTSEG